MKHLLILLSLTTATHALIDENNNGLSDLWEKENNNGDLFSENYDPQADPDQDGWTNIQEAAAGTDPNIPNPPGGFMSPDLIHTPAVMGTDSNGQPIIITFEVLTVSWPTLIGKQYTLLFSPDLSAASWLQVPDSQFIGDGNIHEFNFESSSGNRCFWRVSITDCDSDEDSLTDAEEATLGTDPDFHDTDGDGSSDWAEVLMGLRGALPPGLSADPLNADADGNEILDGDQFDFDQDGTADRVDVAANDNTASYEAGLLPRYAIFSIDNALPVELPPDGSKSPIQINDLGMVLYGNGVWQAGEWTPLISESLSVESASARAINDLGMIVGISSDEDFHHFACWWDSPGAEPVFIGTADGSRMAGPEDDYGATTDFGINLLKPGPVLGNDGTFYYPVNEQNPETGEWTFSHHGKWQIPTNGQGFPTESSASHGLRYSGGADLSWGYNDSTSPQGTAQGWVDSPDRKAVLPFFPIQVSKTPGGGFLALSGIGINNCYWDPETLTWGISGIFRPAVDISADGTAIGRSHLSFKAPVLLNGTWTDATRWLPGESGTWASAGTNLLDTTPGGWILAERSLLNQPKVAAVALPIRAEGNFTPESGLTPVSRKHACGVDDFSIGSYLPGSAIEEKIWIMAPQSGGTPAVTFHSPVASTKPVTLSASGISLGDGLLTGPDTNLQVSASVPLASGAEIMGNVSMGGQTSLSQPLAFKVMKSRVVKVALYKVNKTGANNGTSEPDILIEAESLRKFLNDVFKPQINVTFQVIPMDDISVDWDVEGGNPGALDTKSREISTEVGKILNERPQNRPEANIDLFVLGGGRWIDPSPPPKTGGTAGTTLRDDDEQGETPNACWVTGEPLNGRGIAQLYQSIAHEIGHVIVGYGHPDDETNEVVLPGTNPARRLMCSGVGYGGIVRDILIVKGEWDKAEKWLHNEIDK